MNETHHNPPRVLAVALCVGVGFAAGIGGQSRHEQTRQAERITSPTNRPTLSERHLAEAQPPAARARTLPVTLDLVRHMFSPGYTLVACNQSRGPLRFSFVVDGARIFQASIDRGEFWTLRNLTAGDRVQISSRGYDSKIVPIQ